MGLSRFDRRVQPNLSVLADKWVALFVFAGRLHQNARRDASDTRRKEGLGGGPSAQQVPRVRANAHKERLR